MYTWEPYLNDSVFLKTLDELITKEVYVKIIVLDMNEDPVQEVQGKVISGSLNIDGSSSLRRTGNLVFMPDEKENDITDNNNIISINKRIAVFIGYANDLKVQYSKYSSYDIIWMPLGIYIITNASYTQGMDGVSISIQMQDKMCLLNGTCGGVVGSSFTVNTIGYEDASGNYYEDYVSIYDTIHSLVKDFGGEQIGRIIITDVPLIAKKVMKWLGPGSLYLKPGPPVILTTASGGTITNTYQEEQIVGYQFTPFIYPQDLVIDAGNSVCDVLDKIRDILGNFEYFYDLDGNFRFQEIKNYLNTSQSTVLINQMKSSDYAQQISAQDKTVYEFNNRNLITSFSNSPQYSMIKNDYVVWGEKPIPGSDIPDPIRYHLVIDKKPKAIQKNASGILEDWRNVFYRQGVAASGLAINSNRYYIELQSTWPDMYDTTNLKWLASATGNPADLIYFLDFIDSSYSLNELSVSNIGKRSVSIVDKDVNCIFAPTIPSLIIAASGDTAAMTEANNKGISYAQIDPVLLDNFSLAQGYKDAFSVVRDMLYQYTSYNNTITLQTLPIYHLDVNTLISVYDNETGINGNYIIKSISVPLSINETMSINANQVLERI